MEEGKTMKCYKRLIYKQFVQVSGLCGPQFLRYLPKRFTLCMETPYWCTVLVMAAGNQQKYQEFTFSIKALSLHSRTNIRAHKHIYLLIFDMVILLKIKRRDLSSTREHSVFWCHTHCKTSEVQIAVFSK